MIAARDVAVGMLVAGLLTACDGRGDERVPTVDASGERTRKPSAVAAPAGVGEAGSISESGVAELEAESERLQQECAPAKGESRERVEARFGEGEPVVHSKVPVEVPPDAPDRRYRLSEDGVLFVRYDESWKVERAHFHDPYAAKGRVAGRPVPLDERAWEARQRLAQMRRIRDEIRARFRE